MNKAICGSKESAAPHDELETWKETVLVPTLARYSPNDIYNGDETTLFYKSLPHRTYCFDGDKSAGSVKCKDRLTLLIITNMDGSDHRKLSVIGKSKTPRSLQKKYKMQVKDMAVDWYASKNAWMTGEIHHQIMTKLNNEMRLSNRHILYVLNIGSIRIYILTTGVVSNETNTYVRMYIEEFILVEIWIHCCTKLK